MLLLTLGVDIVVVVVSIQGGGGRLGLVEVVRTADFGVNDVTFHVMTHLCHILQPGDTVMG